MNAVLISGTNGGIGSAIAKQLLGKDYFVIGTDVGPDQFSLPAYISADLRELVSDEQLLVEFRQRVEEVLEGRPLVGLVNNAAILETSFLQNLTIEQFKATMDVNVGGTFALSKALLDLLAKSKGSIVNIGSIHARLTKPGFVNYATSKAALRGLTRSMAVECGTRVRVNLIEPAAIDTPMLRVGFRDCPEQLFELENYHPVGRIGQPQEVSDMIAFLLSEQSGFVTGSVFQIDGGISSRLHDPV